MNDRIDELIDLLEAEPEGLRTAEFLQARDVLCGLAGRRVAEAVIEDTRVVVTTDDGCRYYFYGFLGSDSSARAAKSAPT
ncbi:MAG: hypothetical protein JO190_06365 [Candidatus Eremiobacteraeota bacterium]|nr:hypothetical protein [Candidatus Eremiobacteraeota bacterium]MBV8499139.1 hypothetical protein [Candidatus Eremiobacteraeota bacterium]